MTDRLHTVDALFAGKDAAVRATHARLLEALTELGTCRVEPKKTSIHLARATGFAGVHPRKSYLYLNVRTGLPLDSARVGKREQVSKNRYHNERKLSSPDEVDAEVVGWLRAASALA